MGFVIGAGRKYEFVEIKADDEGGAAILHFYAYMGVGRGRCEGRWFFMEVVWAAAPSAPPPTPSNNPRASALYTHHT